MMRADLAREFFNEVLDSNGGYIEQNRRDNNIVK